MFRIKNTPSFESEKIYQKAKYFQGSVFSKQLIVCESRKKVFLGGRFAIILTALSLAGGVLVNPAAAQRVGENAITSADDAYGTEVGAESIGVYSAYDIRGFSAIKAGNLRIEGIYFDQFAAPSTRVLQGSVVRVGLAALDYSFPAPTGIADYQLRIPGEQQVVSAGITLLKYGGMVAEVDTQLPVVRNMFSVGVGASWVQPEQVDGASFKAWQVGLITRYRHESGEILTMVNHYKAYDQKVRPIIVGNGAFLPKLTPARRYLGQPWALNENHKNNVGFIVRQNLADSWSFRGGLWRSGVNKVRNFSEIIDVDQLDGSGSHVVVADPKQNGRSYSGEAQIAWNGGDKNLRHRVVFMFRGRDRRTESGGSDVINLGPVVLGDIDHEPEPDFTFNTVDVGHVKQVTGGIGYAGWLGDVAQLNLGFQKTEYKASFTHLSDSTKTSDSPWLINAALVINPKPWLSVYGTYVRGLEESGVAPENAANRDELLPASRTRQIEGGVRVTFRGFRISASAFDIKKPYFSFDEANRFSALGDVHHRGIEVSITKQIGNAFNILVGAVLMDPVVTGEARDLGLVGKRPVGVASTLLRLDLNYSTKIEGLSFNTSVVHSGKRAASAQSYDDLGGQQVFVDPYTTVDIGVLYSFMTGKTPMSLRLLVSNVFNEKAWDIVAASAYQLKDIRGARLQLVADF
ncbi:MAG: TonB-dependent receptor [Emcibacter sp.]|nr:TonB-dependent receptor [Emcibacter sp.]